MENNISNRLPVKLSLDFEKRPTANPATFFKNVACINAAYDFVDCTEPDVVMYYNRLQVPPKFKKTKIFYSQEPMNVNMNTHEWAIGYQYEEYVNSLRYLRFPNYILYGGYETSVKPDSYSPENILKEKTKFCAYVFWHRVPLRISMFEALNKYKRVDAPGRCCHNCQPIGNTTTVQQSRYGTNYASDLVNFLKPYKFAIVFENEKFVGRTDEKIFSAMKANCIPIFWGNPEVHKDFNTDSFINAHSFTSPSYSGIINSIVDRVKYLDNDDTAYLNVLRQPWYNNNIINKYVDPQRIVGFFNKVFSKR